MRGFPLILVVLFTIGCVAVQPAPTPGPSTPVPAASTTAEPIRTLPQASPSPTSAPSATATLVTQPSTPSTLTPRLKAVFIVGPEDELTEGNLADAEEMALQAEAAGMDVRRVFFPHATWENVIAEVQGASLVAYLGHGYGFPSNTVKLFEGQQDGMGLNAHDGSGEAEVKYYGAIPIRENIRLAPNAVVFLMRGCYTAGNGLNGTPIPPPELARERVDNYASGWLAVGAGAVLAFQWGTQVNYADALANTDSTVDELFMKSLREHVGWNELYYESLRTPGAVIHLDPDPNNGYLRAVTGDLAMTTETWRAGAGLIVPAVDASL